MPGESTAEAASACLSLFFGSGLAHARQLSAVAVHQALNLRLQRLKIRMDLE